MNKITAAFKIAFAIVAVPWIVFFADVLLFGNLRSFGLRPKDTEHLWGILTTPFLHGSLKHLIANSGALLVLLAVSFYFNRKLAWKALFVIWLLGGGLVWVFASSGTVHIGASGIVFGLVGFLLSIGIFRKEAVALICSLVVFFLYGGSLFSFFTYDPNISWSGHFFGFLSGIAAAWGTKSTRAS